jgi:hypothetical protein
MMGGKLLLCQLLMIFHPTCTVLDHLTTDFAVEGRKNGAIQPQQDDIVLFIL